MGDSDSGGYDNQYIHSRYDDYGNGGLEDFGGFGRFQQSTNYNKNQNRQSQFIPQFDRLEKKKINSYWTIGDDVLLLQLVEKLGKDNWKQVADKVKSKDIHDCQRRYATIRETKEFEDEEEDIDLTWSPQEDSLLMFTYRKYRGNWHKIWLRFQHRDKQSLQQRWSYIVQQQNQVFWDINKDSKVILNYINSCKFKDVSKEIGLSEEQCENRFNHIIAKLSQQLEKQGVKVELPRKILDATIYNEAQLPFSIQTKLQHFENTPATDLAQETNQINDKLAKIQIDQILNDEIPFDQGNLGIKSKIETMTNMETNQNLQAPLTQNINDQVKINDEQIPLDTEELRINDQKEKTIINDTVQMIRKCLEQETQHFDSLFEIKELLSQNIFLNDRIIN